MGTKLWVVAVSLLAASSALGEPPAAEDLALLRDWQAIRARDATVEIQSIEWSSSSASESALVVEKRNQAGRCTIVWHELALSWPTPDEMKVRADRILGQDCCDVCSERDPSGWMIRVHRSCFGDRPKSELPALLDERGVAVDTTAFSRDEPDDSGSRRVRRKNAASLCNFELRTFSCPARFDARGQATCVGTGRGETHRMVWRKSGRRAVLKAISSVIEN